MPGTQQQYAIFETAGGFCDIAWSANGITRFGLPAPSFAAAERIIRKRAPDAEPSSPPPHIANAIAAVKRYFEGAETDFSHLLLDLSGESDLFQCIYAAARQVAWGRTTTYGALAKELGAGSEGARHVGEAMASNPIGLIIPCHRVLAAGGKIGGFSAPGGSTSKLRMLALEGIHAEPQPTAPKPSTQGSFGF